MFWVIYVILDSLETSLLVQHIEALKDGLGVKIPTYDFSTHSRNEAVDEVFPRPIILIEGILILADLALVELLDIKIFVDTDDDIRLIRRLQRDTSERGRYGLLSAFIFLPSSVLLF